MDLQKFWIVRNQVMEQLQGFDILYLENSPHFFLENQFIYHYGRTFNSGDSFGELGLIHKKPSNATLIAHTDCYLASLSSQSYQETLMQVDRERNYKKMMFIKPLIVEKFDNISTEMMSKVNHYFEKN